MAFCASLAEQFETLQGWIAGGNSSGLSSSQADPYLAVPRPNEARTFRYIDQHGTLRRVDLGKEALVELQWGLYLFVPSLVVLGELGAVLDQPLQGAGASCPARQAAQAPAWNPAGNLESWRLRLEVQDASPSVWAQVRAQPGGSASAQGYGTLVGNVDGVKQALQDHAASHFSVSGYAERMTPTIGLNFLGQDPGDPLRQRLAQTVNRHIDSVSEARAFATAWPRVLGTIELFARLDQPPGLPAGDQNIRRPIDLISLSERVLAGLCTEWFGLPEDPAQVMTGQQVFMVQGGRPTDNSPYPVPPRCPGSLYSSSRTIFAPHPNQAVLARAYQEGPSVLHAVQQFLAAGRPLPPLARAMVDDMRSALADPTLPALPQAEAQQAVAGNLAAMLLGFPPTVHGNFLQVMKTWIEDGSLWAQQQPLVTAVTQALADTGPDTPPEQGLQRVFACAERELRPRLMATMRRCPVPETLWRSPVGPDGQVDTRTGSRVVLGIRSALAGLQDHDDAALAQGSCDELMFGGSRDPNSPLHSVHACPGFHLGTGVLLALLSGLLLAGTLQLTGSSVQLMLIPKPPGR
jgi:hypothetical protein